MADKPTGTALPGIAALPPATARQIGSGQVLVDPSSLVKELIDNALDARAKSIFVDITANTLDSIHVKDDGHGIPSEDRASVCRRNCTSKIRDLHDLKEVGGKWLGFRGEALSSVAEMSGALAVTTRVEGEPVAVKLKYRRDGKLASTERDSHPVGTTVKVTHFFQHIPVRKQTAIKNSARCLAKIRRLVQAYALARPAIRFRLHVLKTKNDKGDFIYAPKTSSNVEDAAFKVIGKDCALQCDWTALESEGFEIHAFLPKPTANDSKIANQGSFISVDSRPVSSNRGTMKQVLALFKDNFRRCSPHLSKVKDPFFCMNIVCPPDSYDPNIEPAKDEVMFDDATIVLRAIDKLLRTYYPESVIEIDTERPKSAQEPRDDNDDMETTTVEQGTTVCQKVPPSMDEEEPTSDLRPPPQWRASMYGIDEEDLDHVQEGLLIVAEEEGMRAAEVCNPWTIARMNTRINPNKTTHNGQLLSPAKSHGKAHIRTSSPAPQSTPRHAFQDEPVTPRTSSRVDKCPPSVDDELQQNTYALTPEDSEGPDPYELPISPQVAPRNRLTASMPPSATEIRHQAPSFIRSAQDHGLRDVGASTNVHHNRQKRTKPSLKSPNVDVPGHNDTWFGQPMRGSSNPPPPRRRQKHRAPGPLLFPNDTDSLGRSTETRLISENNTDIRSFFRQRNTERARELSDLQSFTTAHRPLQTDVSSSYGEVQFRPRADQGRPLSQPSPSRATSFELFHRVSDGSDSPARRGNVKADSHYHETSHAFQIYEDDHTTRQLMTGPYSAGTVGPALSSTRSNEAARAGLDLCSNEKAAHNTRDMAAYFKVYQDRENIPLGGYQGPIPRRESRIPPLHELVSKPRSQRRRTTDGLYRTKSSKLPLERVPRGHHVQDIVLPLALSVAGIIQSSHKLDMRLNSLEWKHSTEKAYDVFVEPVSVSQVMNWVIATENSVDKHFERLPGADVRSLFHEAIQRGLDARKGNQSMGTEEIVELPSAVAEVSVIAELQSILVQPSSEHPGAKMQDTISDFDMSQFVNFNGGEDADTESVSLPIHDNVKHISDGFGNDVEDDMLLDL